MKRAKILSASAGSGKTFQLALKYICDIIERPDAYRNILAVTFTNKATEEMKSRILREIHVLASGKKSDYLDNIREKMGLSEEKIRSQALIARNKILHDYSRFNVLTIDKFFQRILRAFIKELGLDLNYEIELDTDMILQRSAESLVNSIPTDNEVRKWLFEFAEERLNDGEKWDIRRELCGLGQQLFGESGAKRMKKITKDDLREIIKLLYKDADDLHQKIKNWGQQALDIMKEYGVDASMFKYGNTGPAGYFSKYAEGELKRPTARLMSGTEKLSNWYNDKGVSGNVVCAAGKLMPILCDIINNVEACIEKTTTANLVREQYRTFALLVDLQRCIDAICKDESIMVLSETKDILAKFIDDNNAPFIYEKIGNRYDHYMIDEFQDTSVREWNNMLPLLKEALASNDKASVFIVGDIKQSIYRWRGGDWRLLSQQALQDLGEDDTEVDHLEQNWRSLENIVKFNNAIIEQIVKNDNLYLNNTLNTAHAAKRISRATYDIYFDIITRAYSDFKQNPVKKSEEKGYAEVCVYDDKLTSSPFIKAIESAVERGYKYRDILILVRGKKDAELAANELLNYKNERFTSQGLPGFNILMAEALSLENCDITEFVKAVLTLSINPKNDLERGFYNRFLGYNLGAQLSDDEKEFLAKISHLSPMEAFEEIVARYNLSAYTESIAYLQAMHEQVIAFNTSRTADIHQFLIWWEENCAKVNVAVEMADNTIEIMTIHKAKGLERDVVIMPYASWPIDPPHILKPKVWAEANSSPANEIGIFPVMFKKEAGESAFADDYYSEAIMNHVDTLNLVYVALTRAAKELYVFVPFKIGENSSVVNTAGKLIVDAVGQMSLNRETITATMDDGQVATLTEYYRFGEPLKSGEKKKKEAKDDDEDKTEELLLQSYISEKPLLQIHLPAQRYIDEGIHQNDAMAMGITLHSIFEKARNIEDIHAAIDALNKEDKEIEALKSKIEASLANPTVHEWFSEEWDDVKCEVDILDKAKSRRPDRVMIKGDRAVVVDYKFGDMQSDSYIKKMKTYLDLLRNMKRFNSVEGYIWYVALDEVVEVK